MKKSLIFFATMLSLPVFALCPIENGETVCSLPGFREQVQPIYTEIPSASFAPNVKLQPMKRTDPVDQMRGPNNNLNYNSGCQFGVCLNNPNKSTLPVQK